MKLEEIKESLIEGQEVSIRDFNNNETLFEGYENEIPEELDEKYIVGIFSETSLKYKCDTIIVILVK